MVHVWAEALAATALVGCAPVLLIFCVPIGRPGYEQLLNSFLSFAVGGLLGDVFLHLLPHAFSAPRSHIHMDPTTDAHGHADDHGHDHHHHSHDHHHDHGHSHDHGAGATLGMWVVAGVMIFFIIERVVRSAGAGGHSHGHGHADEDTQTTHASPSSNKNNDGGLRRRRKKSEGHDSNGVQDARAAEAEEDTVGVSTSDGHIQVAGYLNLAADFTHNFTDGLAIGASFLAGRQIGWITTVAVLFHEVPHEIGDFAILIQSGFSRRAAIYAQLVTAIGALVGTALALLFGGSSTPAILAFTAGGFIYIATVTVIPTLLAGEASLKQSIVEVLMMSAGVGLMVVVGWIEELTEAPH